MLNIPQVKASLQHSLDHARTAQLLQDPHLCVLAHALQTLLHEMIHAYCFLNKLRDSDPTGHGAPFLAKMHFINRATFPDSQVWLKALLKSPNSGLNCSLDCLALPCIVCCPLRGNPRQG